MNRSFPPPTLRFDARPAAPGLAVLLALGLLLLPVTVAAQSWARTDVPSAPPAALAGYGTAVFASGAEIFVGSPGEFILFPMPASRPGLVVVYGPPMGGGTGMEPRQTLTASAGEVGDRFGEAVAGDGDRLIVGAPGAGDGEGSAWLFRSAPDGRWVEERRMSGTAGSGMGSAVAVSGDLALGGMPEADDGMGAVAWLAGSGADARPGILMPADRLEGERFGAAIAVAGDWIAVGAPGPGLAALGGMFGEQSPPLPGSVYIFERTDEGIVERARITDEAAGPAMFGSSIHLTADGNLWAGAPLAGGAKGEVRHYRLQDGEWSSVGSRTVEIPGQGFLGLSIAGNDDHIVAGAPLAGLAAVWSTDGSDPTQLDDGAGQTFFGASVALSGSSAWVGAPGAELFSGLAHEFRLGDDGWSEAAALQGMEPEVAPITGETIECSAESMAAGFPCSDVDLVAFIPLETAGADPGTMANDVWGWTDAEDGREYVLMGLTDRTVFVDVTDPGNPRVLGQLPMTEGAQENLWRDMKVYADHAFIVADGAGQHGMQVFDLTKLRGLDADETRVFEEDAHYPDIASAHNIVINEDTGFAYVVGASSGGTTCGGGLHMIDIREPTNPTFAGCFQDEATGMAGTGYSHDAQCIVYAGPDADHEGAEICFGANETALSIADVSDKTNPVVVSSATYPNSAYLHQGWVSEDHQWFFMNDEGDEIAGTTPRTRTLVWDIRDLDDPILLTEHQGTNSATDHNLYVRGNLMYQANYVSGLRILDVSDPANPVEIAFFDTVPTGENTPGFAGAFSSYPFFESGTIAVTSMREGLFLVKHRARRTVFEE